MRKSPSVNSAPSGLLPEFHQLYNRELSGADEFFFQDGSVQLSSRYKASLRLSLPFPDLVRVLMALFGNPPAGQ